MVVLEVTLVYSTALSGLKSTHRITLYVIHKKILFCYRFVYDSEVLFISPVRKSPRIPPVVEYVGLEPTTKPAGLE